MTVPKALLFPIMVVVVLGILGVAFLISAAFTWLICWAFGFTFTWKIAIGVWAVTIVLGGIFRRGRK